MKKGKIIVIDGIDGAGKTTQAQLLSAHLTRQGIKNEQIKFPRYETFFGQLVLQFLHGEFGSIDQVSPYLASIVFALDRSAVKDNFKNLLEEGTVLVLDRYVSSNMAHQGSKMLPEKREAYFEWITRLEYTELGVPKESVVLFLDTPPLLTKPRLKWKEGTDIHEEDTEYQKQTYEVYQTLCERFSHWHKIECVDTDYNLLSPEDIHHGILRTLDKLFL